VTAPREPFAYLVVDKYGNPPDRHPRVKHAGTTLPHPFRERAEAELARTRAYWEPTITKVLNSRHPEAVPSFRVVGLVELDDQ